MPPRTFNAWQFQATRPADLLAEFQVALNKYEGRVVLAGNQVFTDLYRAATGLYPLSETTVAEIAGVTVYRRRSINAYLMFIGDTDLTGAIVNEVTL